MDKFSIIVPVYNVENYLAKCLDSLINQTYTNIEIICINDGSTDNSLEILNEYARIDNRVILINQENQGVSAARNRGLTVATGDYVLFVDSDDWIESDTCKILIENLITNNSDIIVFNHYAITENIKRPINLVGSNRFTVWNALYKTKIIKNNNIKFPIDIKISEDYFFKFNYLFYVKNIQYINNYLYFYNLTNDNSATKGYKKVLDGDIEAYELLLKTDFYKKSPPEKQLEMTDTWALLCYGIWVATPLRLLDKECNSKLLNFLNYYEQFDYNNYKNLIGYKRLKNKWFIRILKIIRDIFFNIIYRRNNEK